MPWELTLRMSNLTGDPRAVSKKGGGFLQYQWFPGNSLIFTWLLDVSLDFSQLSSLHLAFFLYHSFLLKHFRAGLTPWTSARIFRARRCEATKLVAWCEALCFLWVWDFLELGCFGILGHGKQKNVVISILTKIKWAACLKWGGFCKPQWHQLSTWKGCELGVGGEGGLLCASRQLKTGVQSTESCPKGRE